MHFTFMYKFITILNIKVHVLLFNFSDNDFEVKYGDRIAQMIIEKITMTEIEEVVGDLEGTLRGEGGFGSTGVQLNKDVNSNKSVTEASSTKSDKSEEVNNNHR
jgi:hypothetical protein